MPHYTPQPRTVNREPGTFKTKLFTVHRSLFTVLATGGSDL